MPTPIFERIGNQVAQKFIPKVTPPAKISRFIPAARGILTGDFEGAANSLLNQFLGPMVGSTLEGTPISLAGGLTLARLRQMFQESAATPRAKKNLWFIRFTNIGGGSAPDINFFANDVSYAPHTISGDSIKLGSVHIDRPDGIERVEMNINTLDDQFGTLKNWFADLRYRYARRDGTFGLPSEYLVRVSVTHGSLVEGDVNAYTDSYVMRAGSLSTDLNRREDNIQELAMTFVQFDPFMPL